MPVIYLSPSTQEFNAYINGGTEEYYMNLVADAMEPYLRSSGIGFVRNTPEMTAASSIVQSNAGAFDLHVSLHSNAAPESLSGQLTGTEVYYNPQNMESLRAAEIISQNLKNVYYNPDRVRTLAASELGEVLQTRAPGVLIEYAYHDNETDAAFIKDNIESLARATVVALTEYFGIPFVEAMEPKEGVVSITADFLNIRQFPSIYADSLARAYNGDPITILGQWEDWYVVDYNGVIGYVMTIYVMPVE